MLRDQLDEFLPKLTEMMQKKNFKESAEYKDLISSILTIEQEISDRMVNVQTMIDEQTRGEAARLSVLFFDADVPLLPNQLRYMARQMSQILRLRSNEPTMDFVEERDTVNFDEQEPLE